MTISTSIDRDLAVDETLRKAVGRFFPNASSIELVSERVNLARVQNDGKYWIVRRWPLGTSAGRVAFVHKVIGRATAAGISYLPSVQEMSAGSSTVAEIDGRLFDAQSWLPGNVVTRGRNVFDSDERLINRPAHYSEVEMAAAVRAIGMWHESTRSWAQEPDLPRVSAVDFLRAIRVNWERLRQSLLPIASRTPHIQRWLRTAEVVFPNAVETLAKSDYLRSNSPVIAHLNLWPAHILFSGTEERKVVTGIVDFADAAASSPVVDLAQLITHFNGWTGGGAEEAIGTYADSAKLTPEERRVLPAVAGLDLIAETGRMLELGNASKAIVESGSGNTIRTAAAGLLLSLEAIAPAVQRGDKPEPSKTRKWVHKARKGNVTSPARRTERPTRPKPKT
jgi:Ser/Thr protein kinase RdoA (MazF antagonist)